LRIFAVETAVASFCGRRVLVVEMSAIASFCILMWHRFADFFDVAEFRARFGFPRCAVTQLTPRAESARRESRRNLKGPMF